VVRGQDEPGAGARRDTGDVTPSGRDADLALQREFVAMVLHDLRGPATAVAGFLEVLLDRRRDLDEAAVDALLRRALGAAQRINRLTDDVTAAAAVDASSFTYRLEVFDLVAVVRDTVDQVALTSGRAITVEVVDDIPPVLADEGRQRQILGNLLSNAVKFSPADSDISVLLLCHEADVGVRVRDEGSALTADDVTELFRPFSRVDRAAVASGAGLGLAVVRTLVEGQGGAIWVEPATREGEGTRFVYTVKAAPTGADEVVAGAADGPCGQG
jgi:signal transduction histidine kinase